MTSLIRSNVVNTNKNIELFEEWAIKRGEFGDVYNHASMDVKLEESKFTRDNQQVEIYIQKMSQVQFKHICI